MPVAAQVIEMAEGADGAKRRMLEKIRPLMEKSGLRAVGHDILIAVYNRAGQKTAGGLIMPETNREDDFQGKVGLVLDIGPMCSDEHSDGYSAWFGGKPPKVGDWVGVNTRDAMAFLVGDMTFRLVEWKYLRFTVLAPDKVM